MDFSDIRTIIIGEAGEYGKRLVRYLEIHLSSAVRVYHFTTAEGMVSFKEEAEIYLLDERFFKELSEEKQKFLKQKKLILLTWREEQGSFCKYDNPQKLLDMLSDFTDYNSDLSDLAAELKDTPTKLTIVYSPVYDEYLEQIARSFMSLGDVYMGAEDLGYTAVKRRVFSGYVKHRRDYDAAGDNSIVYVAENGVVYHKNASCSHICLKITGNAAIQDIVHSSKYAACEKCIHKGSSLSAIFVTAYGDCYHSTLGCSGLKRTIKAVRLKDVGRLRPCSRCASGR